MAYFNQDRQTVPPPTYSSQAAGACTSVIARAGMGDINSIAQSLGTDSTHLLLIGGVALVAGYVLNNLLTDIGKRTRKIKSSLRRRRRARVDKAQARAAYTRAEATAPAAPWLPILLGVGAIGLVGVFVYHLAKNPTAGTGASQ